MENIPSGLGSSGRKELWRTCIPSIMVVVTTVTQWPGDRVCVGGVLLRAEHSGVSCSLHADLFGASMNQHLLQKEASLMRAEIHESVGYTNSSVVSVPCLTIIVVDSPLGARTWLATGSGPWLQHQAWAPSCGVGLKSKGWHFLLLSLHHFTTTSRLRKMPAARRRSLHLGPSGESLPDFNVTLSVVFLIIGYLIGWLIFISKPLVSKHEIFSWHVTV